MMRAIAEERCAARGKQPELLLAWDALVAMGNQVGALAGLAEEPHQGELAEFGEALHDICHDHGQFCRQGLDDIRVMLSTGLTALHTIEARGQDVTAPALALWREYFSARLGLMQIARTLFKHGAPTA
jgi:hypothetical protein